MVAILYRWKDILLERDTELTYWGIYFIRIKRRIGTQKKNSTACKGKSLRQKIGNRAIPWTVKATHLLQLMDLAHFPEFQPSSRFHLYPFPKKEVSLYNEIIHTYFQLFYLSSPETLLTWGSCSSPSGSLKSSSAPNFKIADNSSLLKGVELK